MTQGSTVTTTDYIDGIQYTNNVLDFVPTAEGYVKNTVVGSTNTFSYVYNYTDHLGNVRLSYAKSPGNVLTILEENNYYPFGMKHAGYNNDGYSFGSVSNALALVFNGAKTYKFQYNGKEFQGELGLDWSDYGARNYDPAIGRWMNMDPKAEQSRRWSPYSYCYNNPMRFVDPDGMQATDDYKLMKNGDIKLVALTDDKTDRIVKTNSKDEVKTNRKGESKVAIHGIEKGILKDGQNFKNKDQVISIGGKGQPSVAGVKSFTLQLSEHLGKEIKGFSYSSNGSGNVTDMLLAKYSDNTYTASNGTPRELIIKYGANYSGNNMVQQFHTHPDGELGATESAPQISADVEARRNDMPSIPNASFIVLYRIKLQSDPAEFNYTHN